MAVLDLISQKRQVFSLIKFWSNGIRLGSARRGKNKEDGLPVEQLMQLQASVQSMLKKATTFKKSGRFSEAKANLVACARMLEEIGDGQSLQTLAEILKEIIELCKELEQWKEVVGYVKS